MPQTPEEALVRQARRALIAGLLLLLRSYGSGPLLLHVIILRTCCVESCRSLRQLSLGISEEETLRLQLRIAKKTQTSLTRPTLETSAALVSPVTLLSLVFVVYLSATVLFGLVYFAARGVSTSSDNTDSTTSMAITTVQNNKSLSSFPKDLSERLSTESWLDEIVVSDFVQHDTQSLGKRISHYIAIEDKYRRKKWDHYCLACRVLCNATSHICAVCQRNIKDGICQHGATHTLVTSDWFLANPEHFRSPKAVNFDDGLPPRYPPHPHN